MPGSKSAPLKINVFTEVPHGVTPQQLIGIATWLMLRKIKFFSSKTVSFRV